MSHRLFIALWQPNLTLTASYPMYSKWEVLERAMREAYLKFETQSERQKEFIWHFLFIGPELFFTRQNGEAYSEAERNLTNEQIAKWTQKKENCLFIPGSMKWMKGKEETHTAFLFENGKTHESPTFTSAGLRVGVETSADKVGDDYLDVHVVLSNASKDDPACHPNGIYVKNSPHPKAPRVLTFEDSNAHEVTPSKEKQQAVSYVEVTATLAAEQKLSIEPNNLKGSSGASMR